MYCPHCDEFFLSDVSYYRQVGLCPTCDRSFGQGLSAEFIAAVVARGAAASS